MNDASFPAPPPAAIPSAWRTEALLSEAMQMLEANPDLLEDDDIALALSSEVPDALRLLDAMAGAAATAALIAHATDERIDQLRERSRRLVERKQRLREQMANVLQALRLKRYQGANGTISLQAARSRVEVTDEAALPAEYVHVTHTASVDRKAIAAAWAEGKTVPGAAPVMGRATVRVRL